MARLILHVDMDAFYAAVEQRDDPSLAGKPVLVGGAGGRGVVTTASYEARVFGCKSAMPMAQAMRLCPHAVVVRPRMGVYSAESKALRGIFERFTPEIEPVSIDEAYLDCTRSWRAVLSALGAELRAEVGAEVGADSTLQKIGLVLGRSLKDAVRAERALVASVGVAGNKFLAKLASDMDKPDGLRAIAQPDVHDLLGPMDVGVVRGVGEAARAKLAKLGVRTVADLRAIDAATLCRAFGKHAMEWLEMAHGRDARPVSSGQPAKSIGCSTTFKLDLQTHDQARAALLGQVERVARELRQASLKARRLTVTFRRPDFSTFTRSQTLSDPTDSTEALWLVVRGILDAWWAGSCGAGSGPGPLRLTGVSASGFEGGEAGAKHGGGEQMVLFNAFTSGGAGSSLGGAAAAEGPSAGQRGTSPAVDSPDAARRARLDRATDAIVERFGRGAIKRG